MRIAQVAPPFESVPPSHYGGTERVVSLLTEELVSRGHEVTLFASGDSRTSARLVPTVEAALWRQPEISEPLVFWSVTLGEVYRRALRGEFDIIHSHLDFIAFPCAALIDTPTVTTLHGRLDLPDLRQLYARFSDLPVISISDNQRLPLPAANWASTVYNAVDVDGLRFSDRGGDYLAFLGRISEQKGVHQAIEIAVRAGLPLKIAARMPLNDPQNQEAQRDWAYFRERVEPLLSEPGIELVGEVQDAQKSELLSNALALLFPIVWPEPFGLVMAESLASGTPVVARRRGSVPEVVKHGVTGLIGETDDELVDMCRRVREISRTRCRAEAKRRFSAAAMTDGYLEVYERVTTQADVDALLRGSGLTMHPIVVDDAEEPVEPLETQERQVIAAER